MKYLHKFILKEKIENNSVNFIYQGKIINEELKLEEIIKDNKNIKNLYIHL